MREFRPLFGTFLLSTVGDELARIALTLLVYQRTSSPLLSAVTFAISYLPWVLGGPLLSALADRLPRHRVLIVTDAARAVLVAVMAVPGLPLPVLLGLLFLVALCAPPFESARSALMADVLHGEQYVVATSVTSISLQLAQVTGFLVGGAMIAALDPSAALLFDAVTFAVSALWLSLGLRRRPAPVDRDTDRSSLWREAGEGLRLILRTPRLRAIVAILWVATLFGYAHEGVAAPLIDQLERGPTAVGVVLGANPLGVALGGLVVGRLVRPSVRDRLVPFLVALSLAPIMAAGLVAGAGAGALAYGAVVALMFLSGVGGAWLILLNVSFVQSVPVAYRGRAFGVAVSGLYGVQALGMLGAGLAAERLAPSGVVALGGALGLAAVAAPLVAYGRTEDHVARAPDAAGPSGA